MEYIVKKCSQYNADGNPVHLQVARAYATAHNYDISFVWSETKTQVEAVVINGRLHEVRKSREIAGCLLEQTAEQCGVCPKECERCGWNRAVARARIAEIRAGWLTGKLKHLIVKKEVQAE